MAFHAKLKTDDENKDNNVKLQLTDDNVQLQRSASSYDEDLLWTNNGVVVIAKVLIPVILAIATIWRRKSIASRIDKNIISVIAPSYSRRERLLKWVSTQLPYLEGGLATIWADGMHLCALVNSAIPGACPNPHRHWRKPATHGQALAYKYLDVTPIFNEEHFKERTLTSSIEKDLLDYLSALQQAMSRHSRPEDLSFSNNYIARGMGLVTGEKNRLTIIYVYPNNLAEDLDNLLISIRGPYNSYGTATLEVKDFKNKFNDSMSVDSDSQQAEPLLETFRKLLTSNKENNCSNIDIKVKFEKHRAKITYIPTNTGVYEVCLTTNGEHINGSPYNITVEENHSGIQDSLEEIEKSKSIESNNNVTKREIKKVAAEESQTKEDEVQHVLDIIPEENGSAKAVTPETFETDSLDAVCLDTSSTKNIIVENEECVAKSAEHSEISTTIKSSIDDISVQQCVSIENNEIPTKVNVEVDDAQIIENNLEQEDSKNEIEMAPEEKITEHSNSNILEMAEALEQQSSETESVQDTVEVEIDTNNDKHAEGFEKEIVEEKQAITSLALTNNIVTDTILPHNEIENNSGNNVEIVDTDTENKNVQTEDENSLNSLSPLRIDNGNSDVLYNGLKSNPVEDTYIGYLDFRDSPKTPPTTPDENSSVPLAAAPTTLFHEFNTLSSLTSTPPTSLDDLKSRGETTSESSDDVGYLILTNSKTKLHSTTSLPTNLASPVLSRNTGREANRTLSSPSASLCSVASGISPARNPQEANSTSSSSKISHTDERFDYDATYYRERFQQNRKYWERVASQENLHQMQKANSERSLYSSPADLQSTKYNTGDFVYKKKKKISVHKSTEDVSFPSVKERRESYVSKSQEVSQAEHEDVKIPTFIPVHERIKIFDKNPEHASNISTSTDTLQADDSKKLTKQFNDGRILRAKIKDRFLKAQKIFRRLEKRRSSDERRKSEDSETKDDGGSDKAKRIAESKQDFRNGSPRNDAKYFLNVHYP